MADLKSKPHGAPKKTLRNKSEISKFKTFLVGTPALHLSSHKLPTKANILARYLGLRQEYELNGKPKEPVKNIANVLLTELFCIWNKAAIPCIRQDKGLEKVLKLISEFDSFLKHWSEGKDEKVENFKTCLQHLFDLAPKNIDDILRSSSKTNSFWQEDLQFYRGQCEIPQIGSLGVRDTLLEKRLKKIKDRKDDELKRKQKEVTDREQTMNKNTASGINHEEDRVSTDEEEYTPSKKLKKKTDGSPSVLELTSPIAVKHGLSTRAHLAIVAGTAQALGCEFNDIPGSVSSAHRKRKSVCKSLADKICKEYKVKWSGWPKVVQWDGKIMAVQKEDGTKKEDVNVVVLNVPGSGEKLKTVAIPAVKDGSGDNLAESTLTNAEKWTCSEDIFAGSFDTTSANTGIHEGAMTHIEEILKRKVLWMPCRHHIAELHIKHAFQKVMHFTSSPDDPLFKAFKEWFVNKREADKDFPSKDTHRLYDWGTADEGVLIGPLQKEENWFCRETLLWVTGVLQKETFCRGDYKELCELIFYLLTGKV